MEPKFEIDGREYPVPALDSFTFDEWEILYKNTGLTLETVEDAPLSPGLVRTLLTVAYLRAQPEWKLKRIEAIVGALNFLHIIGMLSGGTEEEEKAEEDADPPPEAASSPRPSETSNPDTSDPGSASGSGTLAVVPPPTGTPLSVTQHTSSREASAS